MRISMSTVVFLMVILMLSIFVANVANLISIDAQLHGKTTPQSDIDLGQPPPWNKPKLYEIGDSSENLIWFLQISDIHISIFQDASRISDFREFCDVTVSAVMPQVVLVSGDLTDAKTKDKMGSNQILDEWKHYRRVLDETNVLDKTLWLDVRGNHDNFNVLHPHSRQNYYANYSVQGQKNPRSYMHQITVGNEKYTFIALDACLQPGPRRPFNFIGVLGELEMKKIINLVRESREENGDFIIWFGHYPTSCIMAQCDGGVRSVIGQYKESMVYLCGHLHTLGGTVPDMYTLQQEGFLELELADWKDNRKFRLATLDHGQFSFVDQDHRKWPLISVTNPKNALFVMPQKENLQSIIQSTHVRILAFSLSQIRSVHMQINYGPWKKCRHVKGPLYVAKWNATKYSTGLHYIQVKVLDADGREGTISQPFSLDGTRMSFRVLPRLLLMSDINHIFQFLFGCALLILVVPLCAFRCLHMYYESKRIQRPRNRSRFFHSWMRKLWILSSIDRLFFPIVLHSLYLTIGPWAVGEIIENETGIIFAWGMFIGNSYLPGSLTYAYGFFQLFSFHLPLTLILAHKADLRVQKIDKVSKGPPSTLRIMWRNCAFIILVALQSFMIYYFWLAYGTLATLLCPLRTWSLIMAIVLWYQIDSMPQHSFRSVM